MSVPFACPRCGSVSRSRHDALDGYCGRCHARTGGPAELAAMGRHEYGLYLELQRAAGNPAPRRVRRLGRQREHSPPAQPEADRGSWLCPACGSGFEVPPGYHGPVLCDRHRPPEVMVRASAADFAEFVRTGSWELGSIGASAQLDAAGCSMEELSQVLADARVTMAGYADAAALEMFTGQIQQDLGPAPETEAAPGERGEVMAQMAYVPDYCPPPRALPDTLAPSERGTDDDTAARVLRSDYDAGDIFL